MPTDPLLIVAYATIGVSIPALAYLIPRDPAVRHWRTRRWLRAQRRPTPQSQATSRMLEAHMNAGERARPRLDAEWLAATAPSGQRSDSRDQ